MDRCAPDPADVVLRLSGDLDLGTADDVRRRLVAAGGGGARVEVDAAAVDFVDCTGLTALVAARETLDGRLHLVAASERLLALVRWTGCDALLPGDEPQAERQPPSELRTEHQPEPEPPREPRTEPRGRTASPDPAAEGPGSSGDGWGATSTSAVMLLHRLDPGARWAVTRVGEAPPAVPDRPGTLRLEHPLVVGGEVVGAVHGSDCTGEEVVGEAVEAVAALLSAVVAADRRAASALGALTAAREMAELDALTGLLNRRGWLAALLRAQERCREGATAVVAAVDLDDLKRVNDAEGHAAGDALLRTAARVLAGTCRPQDVAARTGGDEFGVLAVGSSAAGASALERRLEAALASAGVRATVAAGACPAEGDLSATWTAADAAMCARKRRRGAGRG
ncbi:diguanylate cyclase [Pseudokineococcus basanitobsidens]|uniref:Diguanylate cyclase n=1 Tax=Pseudokineococcus basanitobsidens TaxID=1926649 RepID=A0ABU8RMS9_9ACTN